MMNSRDYDNEPDFINYQTIISEMTLEEKFRYLTGAELNASYKLERFPIKQMRYHDGPFGLRMKMKDDKNRDKTELNFRSAFPNAGKENEVPSTAFPTGCALGASWDKDLVEEVGEALGEEFAFYGVNAILGPSVNIKRHPFCGRNFEYFSEDPYLTGKLGSAYVRGVQKKGVAACPKHFAANNQEKERHCLSSEIDERTLREIYLKPFEIIVKEASPWSIMCAYTRLNGVFASEHQWLLQEVLREEWGFDGMVISDWGAVKNRAYSLLASVEMCMPYQKEAFSQLEKAYEEKIIDEEIIDEALLRIFRFYDRTKGVYKPSEADFEEHHQLAVKAANKSMVLLKNEGQILPLQKETIRRLLVLGEGAVQPYIGGDGSSRVVMPTKVTIPLEELRNLLGDEVQIDFMGANKLDTYRNEIGHMEQEVMEKASKADIVLVFLNQDFSCHSEAVDRSTMEISSHLEYAMRTCARVNPNLVAVLNVADAVSMWKWKDCVRGILVSWLGGQGMGRAIAETLCGKNNPSGKLPETFPKHSEDVKSLKNYPGDGYKVVYEERMMVGYRHFDTNNVEPEYEFGFGLSYSDFQYSDLTLEGEILCFTIKNTSNFDGEEIAQVYVEFPKNSWSSHPLRELRAFKKVMVPAGESVCVSLELPKSAFTYYNSALHRWMVEEGVYRIWVGSSSRNLPLSVEKEWKAEAFITNSGKW